jgi:putative ABC transport system permease protein
MFRNCLAAAWRNANRDRLHSVINVVGLAIGMAATILIALYLRSELSYDNFLAGGDRVYRVSCQLLIPGREMVWRPGPPSRSAPALAIDFPEFEGVARLAPDRIAVRRGAIEALELVFWADPSFLDVMGLKTIAGDAANALNQPDSVVLTRSLARKYFGSDAPLGAMLEFSRQDAMRVTAIIDDLPPNTHLATQIIASGRAPASLLRAEDDQGERPATTSFGDYVYVRLKPGVAFAAIQDRLSDFTNRHFPPDQLDGEQLVLKLDPIRDIHLTPYLYDMREGDDDTTLAVIGLVGVLIIAVASVNFINMMTARAARRAVEVGVRKALGATRSQLVVQFVAEALCFAGISALLALAVIELVLPGFDAVVDRGITFAYWRDPELAGGIIGLVLLVGIGAGLYPAFALSRFSPASVLKSARSIASGGGGIRQALVMLQFSVLIGLIVATLVMVAQTNFATQRSLRLNSDQVTLVRGREACRDGFRDHVGALPGVRRIACSHAAPLDFSNDATTVTLRNGTQVDVDLVNVDFGFFELYQLQPLAGRFFDADRGEDIVPADRDAIMQASIILNEAAVRVFGFAAPAQALGQEVSVADVRSNAGFSRIVGVVPDFPIGTIRQAVQPSVFFVDPRQWQLLSIKIDGQKLPETLAAIDRAWAQRVEDAPIRRMFLADEIEKLYRDVQRQGQIFAGFSAIVIVIGCLGLFGLSSFAVERRIKEIGIRKALGASSADVVRLFIWQFTKPVLVANLIAWPIVAWLMQRWLDGFAYRIQLSWPPFLAAGGVALAITIATTGFHAFQVARSRPVQALRYE